MSKIRVWDLEFDGTPETGGGVIEIGYVDLVSQSTDLYGNPTDWIIGEGKSRLCNPGRPITPESMAVHLIEDEDVADAPDWKSLMASFFKKGREEGVIAYASHSADAERQWVHPDWLGESPTPFICTLKAAYWVWPEAPAFKNQVLRFWRRPTGLDRKTASDTHRAYSDAYVTAHLLRDLLNDEGIALEQLIEWTEKPALLPRCKFGDYRDTNDGRGTPWGEVDVGLLQWVLNKSFDENTMFTARYWMDKHEMDQREERERQELNRQLRENGLPVDGETDTNPLTDERQEALQL